MDFRTPKTIGRDINADDVQLHNANGYDHNWVLDTKGDITACAATLENTGNGIRMEVNALNSYDRPIHLVYEGMPVMDAIEEANAEKNSPAKKYLQNGELRIRRADGTIFTVLGQEIKD